MEEEEWWTDFAESESDLQPNWDAGKYSSVEGRGREGGGVQDGNQEAEQEKLGRYGTIETSQNLVDRARKQM